MARNYSQNSPSIYTKFELNGNHFCLPLHLPKKPPGWEEMSTNERSRAMKTIDKLAVDAESHYKATANGELTEEEFLDGMRIIFRRLTRTFCQTPIVIFLAAWLWQRSLRNRPDFHKVAFAVEVLDDFLAMWKADARKPLTTLRPLHFNAFIRQRREDGYTSTVVNDEIQLLRALGRDLRDRLGYNPASELEFEASAYGRRQAFTEKNLRDILKVLRKSGIFEGDWKTIIMLVVYLPIRPGEACRLTRSAINTVRKTIKFRDSKSGKVMTKAINKVLWEHLEVVLKTIPTDASALLTESLYYKSVSSRSLQFRRILQAAGIPLTRVELDHAKVRQYAQCLYSLRKTFNIWLHGITTKKQRQKHMGHSTAKAHEHYEDDSDPYVIEQERKVFDMSPRII